MRVLVKRVSFFRCDRRHRRPKAKSLQRWCDQRDLSTRVRSFYLFIFLHSFESTHTHWRKRNHSVLPFRYVFLWCVIIYCVHFWFDIIIINVDVVAATAAAVRYVIVFVRMDLNPSDSLLVPRYRLACHRASPRCHRIHTHTHMHRNSSTMFANIKLSQCLWRDKKYIRRSVDWKFRWAKEND